MRLEQTTRRSSMSELNKPSIYPFLRYRDAPGAMDFLKSAFGFEEMVCHEGPAGTIAHAELNLGPCVIMVGSSRSEKPQTRPSDLDDIEQGIYIAVPDIDQHYETARAAGARIAREINETDYGAREYSAFDTEGYWWSFGTYQPAGKADA
jgi:uncharacterized glyoxalase superfamily protein PhnB